MTKISIKNFQSIKKIDFDINGFTVIIGKNNIGKSAIVRSIEYALINEPGDNFIRTGEKSTEVRIQKEDTDIKWMKGDTASYEINKETYSKLNRSVPQSLIKAGFEQIEVGNKKTLPLIASQHDPLFLIDEPGSTVTEVLASLYNINTLSTADDLCQKDLKSKKSLSKLRNSDLLLLQGKLEKYKNFDIIKNLIDIVTKKNNLYNKLESEVKELVSYENQINLHTDQLEKLKDIKKIKIPGIKQSKNSLEDYTWLKDKEIKYHDAVNFLNKIKDIKNISVPNTKNCKDLIADLNWISDRINIYNNTASTINKIRGIYSIIIPSVLHLNDTNKEFLLVSDWVNKASNLTNNLKKYQIIDLSTFIEKNVRLSSLINDLNRVKDMDEEYQKVGKSAKFTRDELKGVMTELEIKQKEKLEIKSCPLCGGPLK